VSVRKTIRYARARAQVQDLLRGGLGLIYQHTPGAVRTYVSDASWFNMKSATSAREMRTVSKKLPT
jgi:hypothetical protein